MLQALLNDLLNVQLLLAKEMPDEGTPLRSALDIIDAKVDYLEGYLEAQNKAKADGINISDRIAYFEMARWGMAMVGDEICDEMDMSDEEFLRLQEQLYKYMNGDGKG